ncbi:TLR cluster1 member 30 [Biomphalaria glabrata]|nr:toll-like receptor 4 [Biomphalaria glabrata]
MGKITGLLFFLFTSVRVTPSMKNTVNDIYRVRKDVLTKYRNTEEYDLGQRKGPLKQMDTRETRTPYGHFISDTAFISPKNILKATRPLAFHLRNLKNQTSPCSTWNLTVDCSYKSLDHIESSWFPSNTTVLLLNNNKLVTLHNETFAQLTNLTRLDLSSNDIRRIDAGAFQGLHNLQELNLHMHCCNFTDHYSLESIFAPLRNLRILNAMHNSDVGVLTYSYTFLTRLPLLQSLSIDFDLDTLDCGPEFNDLKNLTFLQFSGQVMYIDDRSFQNVAQLKNLSMDHLSNINNISHNAFKPLSNLKVLTMYHVLLYVQEILSLLEPFQGRNMTEITLDTTTRTLTQVNPTRNGILTDHDTKYLMNICLESFTLIDNRIFYIKPDAVQNIYTWKKCLMHLYIASNPIQGNNFALIRLFTLDNLKSFTFINMFRACHEFQPFPQSSPPATRNVASSSISSQNNHYQKDTTSNQQQMIRHSPFSPYLDMIDENPYQRNTPNYIFISPSLQYMNFQRLVMSQSFEYHFILVGAQNVTSLDISDSGFYRFNGLMEGVSAIKTLIISGNDVSVLSVSFFDTFVSLENFAISSCKLDRDFISLNSRRIFQNHTRLQELDISSNSLNYLSQNTFSYNNRLMWLNMSGNQFKDIPFDLTNTPELQFLDIRFNSLTTIDETTAQQMDHLVTKSGKLEILLEGNVLSCSCSDLSFMRWMRMTLVTFDQNGNFTCMNTDGERKYTLDYSNLDSLWRECWGSFFLYFALIMLCLYCIGVFAVFITMRNKNFIVSFFLQLFGGFKLHSRRDYPVGVYIGYSDKDYQFPCKELRSFIESSLKLKTFLIDRDLIASVDKASGIIEALNASWRILLVCSESFLKEDDWSMFTMRSAIYTQTPANPARVVVLVHKDCLPLLPPALLSSVNDENICAVSEWAMNYEMMQMLTTRLH